MEPKKLTLPAAAFAIGLASFAAGQQNGRTPVSVKAVSMLLDPAPVLTVVVKGPEGPTRRRIYCGGSSKLDGVPFPAGDTLCTAALLFQKNTSEQLGGLVDPLSK